MKPIATKLLRKIQTRKAKIAVIGLGYVGLPLSLGFVQKGFRVLGIDLDPNRVAKIQKGLSYVEDVSSRELRRAVRRNRLRATETHELLAEMDAVILCVPTPLNRARDPDLSNVMQAVEAVGDHLREGQLIILESTTYPGTTDELVVPALERSGLKVGREFFVCFSPERIDPGNKKFPLSRIPKVVGGMTPDCTALGSALYSLIAERVVPVSSARAAEMAKLLENTFRIVNIGLINELARVAQYLQVNIWEVIRAASTKPFGYMPFYPGPGIGGHCIGIDPIYLSWKARVQGVDVHFIDLARRINTEMPRYVVERAAGLLNSRAGKAVSRAKILLLGVSYKANVGDIRESPALEILEGLKRLGARLSYHDPYVPEVRNEQIRLRSEPLGIRNLRSKDLVIVTTGHTNIDYGRVAKHARLIFDTRNVSFPAAFHSKVVLL